jgi:Leucine-rich repeat (LRR) protein
MKPSNHHRTINTSRKPLWKRRLLKWIKNTTGGSAHPDEAVVRRGVASTTGQMMLTPSYTVDKDTGRVLTLQVYAIREIFPTELGKLDQLQELLLHSDSYASSSKPHLALDEICTQLTNLRVLKLQGPITRLPPEIQCLTQLHTLELNGWPTDKEHGIPSELHHLSKSLRILRLCSTTSLRLPPEIWRLKNLQELELRHFDTQTTSCPRAIGSMTQLEILKLHENRHWETLPVEMGQLRRLRVLDLSECTALHSLPSEICTSCGQLQELRISKCYQLDILTFLGELWPSGSRSLETLDLRNNRLGLRGRDLSKLWKFASRCPNLEYIGLKMNQIVSLDDFQGLEEMTSPSTRSSLRRLDLSLGNPVVYQPTELDQNRFIRILMKHSNLRAVDFDPLQETADSQGLSITPIEAVGTKLCTPLANYWLDLNTCGRGLLRSKTPVSLWPVVLARVDRMFGNDWKTDMRRANVLYYLLRNGPDIFASRMSFS